MKKLQKGFSTIFLITITVIILAFGIGWWIYNSSLQPDICGLNCGGSVTPIQ